MSNPFKEILQHHEVPQVLKQRVMNDVNMIKLTMDIADLFLVKYPSTIGDVFGGNSLKKKK
ncbi:hypothetical protein [Polaribacter glomeratus]|uniref:Uncharacterized protein n=1 Tax=Polaribacter glomeratus TaxID=102 RepID=A0A2S7WYW5_9FLAO|nr:hypothetical protein [Polaribacter glomeratus]PQJ82718.1 hypothetical protein BTO16_09070 [Polaribacter glomeratus]TXD65265.1 hypothetical protein ESX12_10560 [Polaribacter glomeratus]